MASFLPALGALVQDWAATAGTGGDRGTIVPFLGTPRIGKDAAREFYRFLTANIRTEGEQPLHRFFDGDNMIPEQNMTCTVIGEFVGIPGNGKRVTFRILHVFAFRDGLICREQVWLDSRAIVAQLSAQ